MYRSDLAFCIIDQQQTLRSVLMIFEFAHPWTTRGGVLIPWDGELLLQGLLDVLQLVEVGAHRDLRCQELLGQYIVFTLQSNSNKNHSKSCIFLHFLTILLDVTTFFYFWKYQSKTVLNWAIGLFHCSICHAWLYLYKKKHIRVLINLKDYSQEIMRCEVQVRGSVFSYRLS